MENFKGDPLHFEEEDISSLQSFKIINPYTASPAERERVLRAEGLLESYRKRLSEIFKHYDSPRVLTLK